jgi:hypothetical protein
MSRAVPDRCLRSFARGWPDARRARARTATTSAAPLGRQPDRAAAPAHSMRDLPPWRGLPGFQATRPVDLTRSLVAKGRRS